jgi:hypothetical protein
MSSEIVLTVIAINNRCVEQLCDSKLKESLQELQHAISLTKKVVATVDHASQQVRQIAQSSSILGATFLPDDRSMAHSPIQSQQLHELINSNTPIVMCHRPLLLYVSRENHDYHRSSSVQLTEGNFSSSDVHLVCAVLLFNIALICHKYSYNLHRVQNQSPVTCYLVRASKLYVQLIAFLNICDTNSEMITNTTRYRSYISMIQMVAYNNYGQICYEIGNYTQYQYCMNEIQHGLLKAREACIDAVTDHENDRDVLTPSTSTTGYEIVRNEIQLNVLVCTLFRPEDGSASAA